MYVFKSSRNKTQFLCVDNLVWMHHLSIKLDFKGTLVVLSKKKKRVTNVNFQGGVKTFRVPSSTNQ